MPLPLLVLSKRSVTLAVEDFSLAEDARVVCRPSFKLFLLALHSMSERGAGIGPGFGLKAGLWFITMALQEVV